MMMRYALVVLACLSIAAGQDTIRGSRSDLKEQATVENEKTRNLQNAHHSDGQMRPEAMMAGPKAAIEQLKAGQKEEKTEETKNEISQLKAALKEEKDEIKAMKQELQNEEAQIVGTTGGETYVTDTGEQDSLDDIPPEDLFDFHIGITPKKPCLQKNMDQVLLAMFRVGFMDLDACFDEVIEESRRLAAEGDNNGNEADRMLSGNYRFAGGGCRRCRGKRKRSRSGGRRRLEKFKVVERGLQNENSSDPLAELNIKDRMELALQIAIEETFGENDNNCLFGTTIDDVDFRIVFGVE